MNIHEFQAKQILKEFGVSVPESIVCATPEEASAAFEKLGTPVSVVKAQIHAGGRGKGGGVKLVKSAAEAAEAAKTIMSKPLITHQTGPEGQPVKKILVEMGSNIADELYIGIAMDRSYQRPVMMASSEGGMDIEEVAAATPEKILSFSVDPATGYQAFHGRRIAFALSLSGPQIKQ